jgi:superfamily II DNA or RNA helicase
MKLKTLLNNKGYIIPVDGLSKTEYKNLIRTTTVIPYKFGADVEELDETKYNVHYYTDKSKTHIVVPKFYGIYKYGKPHITDYDDCDEIDVTFTKQLREKQTKVAALAIDHILEKGGGLLSLPCGAGKTVISLYIASRLGYKTLIVVHLDALKDQWIERMMEFLDIKRERIGVIQGKVCDVKDKDIVIAMIQTLSQKEYDDLFKCFGFVIYDEAHHMPAKQFSRGLLKTNTKYTLSLSATPYRGDGTMKVLYWFTGPTIYKEEIKINKHVIVKRFNYRCNDKKYALKKRWFKGGMVPDTVKMLGNIIDVKARNNLLVGIMTHLILHYPERKILFLTARRVHAEQLKERIDKFIEDNRLKTQSHLYIGSTRPNKRREAEKYGDIIFATYNMAQEGLDIKRMNTLVMGTPKKDVVQTVGRIMRELMRVNSIRPLIIDINDDIGGFNKWNNQRSGVYNKCEYNVDEHFAINDEFMTGNTFYEIDDIKDKDRERHHDDYNLNKMINKLNNDFIELFNVVRKADDNLQHIKALLNRDSCESDDDCSQYTVLQTDDEIMEEYGITYSKDDVINFELYDNFEAYTLKDIFNIPRVTKEDLETVVINSKPSNTLEDNDENNYLAQQQKSAQQRQIDDYYKAKNKGKKKKWKNPFI